jgi:hypothetical protein
MLQIRRDDLLICALKPLERNGRRVPYRLRKHSAGPPVEDVQNVQVDRGRPIHRRVRTARPLIAQPDQSVCRRIADERGITFTGVAP